MSICSTELNYLYCGREHPLFNVPDGQITTAGLGRESVRQERLAVNSDLQQANTAMGKRVVGFSREGLCPAHSLRTLHRVPAGTPIGNLGGKGRDATPASQRYEATVNFSIMTAQADPQTVAQSAFLSTLRAAAAKDRDFGVECAVA